MGSMRMIAVEEATGDLLEKRAEELGLSVSDLLGLLLEDDPGSEPGMFVAAHQGAWAPEVLAEDERRLAAFVASGEGAPAEDVVEWLRSWATDDEVAPPKPRLL